MKKALIAITALTASALIAGCANVPREAHRINLITLDEAEANHCKSLGWVGSVSVLLINGKARNTAVILKKAVKMPGATHIAYTKGEAGYATTRAQVLSRFRDQSALSGLSTIQNHPPADFLQINGRIFVKFSLCNEKRIPETSSV